jgi:hypothetical protein
MGLWWLIMVNNLWLVVTGTHGILNDFPYIGNHISIDELIFFRGVGQPPTSHLLGEGSDDWKSGCRTFRG